MGCKNAMIIGYKNRSHHIISTESAVPFVDKSLDACVHSSQSVRATVRAKEGYGGWNVDDCLAHWSVGLGLVHRSQVEEVFGHGVNLAVKKEW